MTSELTSELTSHLQLYWVLWILLLTVGLYLTWLRPRSDMTLRLPGPWAWPVLGNLLQLGSMPHHTLSKWSERYGSIFQIQMGSRPTVILCGINMIKQACIKQAEDFAGRPDFYTFNFIANGKSMGFGDYGARWRMHRRIAQNALAMFVNSRDNPMEEAIQDEARTLVKNLTSAQSPVDPHDEIYLSVGNIICALCFGKRYNREDEEFKLLVKMNADFMAYVGAGKLLLISLYSGYRFSFTDYLI